MAWVPPTPVDLAFLQHAQELALRRRRQIANLVEQERAAVGQLEPAETAAIRAGERAFFVTEQLTLEQAFGQRGTVDRDKRA